MSCDAWVGLDVQETGFSNESKPMRAVNHESSGCFPPHGPGPFTSKTRSKNGAKNVQDLSFLLDVFLKKWKKVESWDVKTGRS